MKLLASVLSKLVAALLVLAIFGAVVTVVTTNTILNSHFFEQKAAQVNAYVRLSDGISAELAKDSGNTSPAFTAAVQKIISPDVLQQKINGTLDQLEAYEKGNGQVPTIDLTSLVNQARAAGVPIPPNTSFDQPIQLTVNRPSQGLNKQVEGLKIKSIASIAILFIILLVLTWETHRYKVLPDIAIVCGLLFGIVAIILILLPTLANDYIKFNFSANIFASIAHDLALAVVRGIGDIFGIIAIVFLAIGIPGRLLLSKL